MQRFSGRTSPRPGLGNWFRPTGRGIENRFWRWGPLLPLANTSTVSQPRYERGDSFLHDADKSSQHSGTLDVTQAPIDGAAPVTVIDPLPPFRLLRMNGRCVPKADINEIRGAETQLKGAKSLLLAVPVDCQIRSYQLHTEPSYRIR